jgi:transposase-like protein
MDKAPKTLQEAIVFFDNEDNCHKFMMELRWPDGAVKCPNCGSSDVAYLPNAKVFKCYEKHPCQKFSLKVDTVMEDSPISLKKWLPVIWMVANCRNGVSSWEIHRSIGVSQKTAWFMLQRARLAMQDDLTGGMLGGEVEVDETFIGGKVRNMHKKRKLQVQKRAQSQKGNKAIVLGILERATEKKPKRVRATVVADRKKPTFQEEIRGVVQEGTTIHSDEFAQSWKMDEYEHQIVNHLTGYVRENCHTNGLENFWSLLKRGINGTYVAVEPFHLFRYVDEQAFRFNNRLNEHGDKLPDYERFSRLCSQVVGRRLTYKELTGKEGEPSSEQEPPTSEEALPF